MARKRMIDPVIWHDPDFGELDFPEQVFFIGLFSNADDEGRIIADPRHLRAAIFEYKDISTDEVRQIRDEVVSKFRNLEFYVVDGRDYLSFRKWGNYQTISHPTPSRLPAPPNGISSDTLEPFQNDSGTVPTQYSIDKNSIVENSVEQGADALELTPKQKRDLRLAELKAKGDILQQLARAYAEGMGWAPEKVAETTYHSSWSDDLLAMHKAGWTPDDVKGCTKYTRTETYWIGKTPPLKVIRDNLPEWESRNKPKVYQEPVKHNGRPRGQPALLQPADIPDPPEQTGCEKCGQPWQEWLDTGERHCPNCEPHGPPQPVPKADCGHVKEWNGRLNRMACPRCELAQVPGRGAR